MLSCSGSAATAMISCMHLHQQQKSYVKACRTAAPMQLLSGLWPGGRRNAANSARVLEKYQPQRCSTYSRCKCIATMLSFQQQGSYTNADLSLCALDWKRRVDFLTAKWSPLRVCRTLNTCKPAQDALVSSRSGKVCCSSRQHAAEHVLPASLTSLC